MFQNPSVGGVAVVHNASCVNLGDLDGMGIHSNDTSVVYGETPANGRRWCWPPKV